MMRGCAILGVLLLLTACMRAHTVTRPASPLTIENVHLLAPHPEQPQFFGNMSATLLGDTLIVVGRGHTADELSSEGPHADSIAAKFLGIRMPPGDRPILLPSPRFALGRFDQPIIGTSRDGTIHLFWRETQRPPGQGYRRSSLADSIWYTAFADGAWTTPRVVLRGRFLAWTPALRSRVVSDTQMHFVMPHDTGGINYFRADKNSVSVERLPFGRGTLFVSAAVAFTDSIMVAVQAVSRVGEIVRVRSTDYGKTWGEPVIVHRSDLAFSEVDASFGPDRTLHLLSRRIEGDNTVLSYMQSVDFGITWSTPIEYMRAGTLRHAEIILGQCGEVYAMIDQWDPVPTPILLRLDRSAVIENQILLADSTEAVGFYVVARDERGDNRIVWSTVRAVAGRLIQPRTRTATIAPGSGTCSKRTAR